MVLPFIQFNSVLYLDYFVYEEIGYAFQYLYYRLEY